MHNAHSSQQQQTFPSPGPQPANVPVVLPLTVWGATDKGRQREGNEDAVYPHSKSDTFSFEPGAQPLSQKGHLLIVADGVGGAKAGREASHWAIRVAVERYYDLSGPDLGADLRTAIEAANASLYQYLESTGSQEAGCTMAAAVIHKGILYVANVGDSRVYLLRDGQITQLTRDHTLTQQKIDHQLIRPDQADMDPDSNVLTRSMGARPSVQADLFQPQRLVPGDVALLCSDGLTDMLEDTQVARLAGGAPKRAAKRLIAAANRHGGVDNISVVLARAGGKSAPSGDGLRESISQLGVNIARMDQRQKITVGGIAALVVVVICALIGWITWSMSNSQRPTPAPIATTPPPVATTMPAEAPGTLSPTDTVPAGEPTSTARPTFTPVPTSTPAPTAAPNTAAPQPLPASSIELITPTEGEEYVKSPITFEWHGDLLRAGQMYQVTVRCDKDNYTTTSDLLTDQKWVYDPPAEKHGLWYWKVLMLQNGQVMAASEEWPFWFDPTGVPGGGNGDSTATPEH